MFFFSCWKISCTLTAVNDTKSCVFLLGGAMCRLAFYRCADWRESLMVLFNNMRLKMVFSRLAGKNTWLVFLTISSSCATATYESCFKWGYFSEFQCVAAKCMQGIKTTWLAGCIEWIFITALCRVLTVAVCFAVFLCLMPLPWRRRLLPLRVTGLPICDMRGKTCHYV